MGCIVPEVRTCRQKDVAAAKLSPSFAGIHLRKKLLSVDPDGHEIARCRSDPASADAQFEDGGPLGWHAVPMNVVPSAEASQELLSLAHRQRLPQ